MPSAGPIIDSDLLCAFAAFAETRSFTRAARLVGLSQPALFERIQRLQALLAVPLYRRAGRDLEMTEAGLHLCAHAREVQERERALLRRLRGEPDQDEAILAAGEGSYLYLLGEALQALPASPPPRLRLLTLGSTAACAALRSGDAHLAVCALDLVPDGLAAQDLLCTPMCAVVARGHRLARRDPLTLGDLRGERLILAPPGQLHRDLLIRALSRAGCDIVDPIEADGWPLMLRFAELGLGVAFVNGVCTRPRPPPGTVALPLPELGQLTYRLLRRSDARLPPLAETLARLILEKCAAEPPRSSGGSPRSPESDGGP